jgi:hypothetical protein
VVATPEDEARREREDVRGIEWLKVTHDPVIGTRSGGVGPTDRTVATHGVNSIGRVRSEEVPIAGQPRHNLPTVAVIDRY